MGRKPLTRCGLLLLALFFLTAGSAAAQSDNERKESAWVQYKKIQEQYREFSADPTLKKALKIEGRLLKVLELVAEDTPKLRYNTIEERLIHGNSRWAQFEKVTIPHSESYLPNRLLGKLRHLFPPKPRLTSLVCREGEKRKLVVRISNLGETGMNNITISLGRRFGTARDETIGSLPPGGTHTVTWNLDSIKGGPWTINMDEKFGFASCPQHLTL